MGDTSAILSSDLFRDYIDKHKHEVRDSSSEQYYHVDVVADAYNQGFSDGEKSGRKDFLDALIKREVEKFTQKANQIYILSHRIIDYIKEIKFSANALYINLSPNRPSVIISIPNKDLTNDEFVKKSYTKLNEIKKIYTKLFNEYLDMGFVSSDNLDDSILHEDGFGYKEELSE